MKQCDLCGKKDATMRVSRVDKVGKATELEVCAECATRHGFAEVAKVKQNVNEIISDLKSRVADEDAALVCPRCGMTFAEFKRLGRVGCAECYSAFHDQLQPLVRRIHGSAQHVGRTIHGGRKQAHVKVNVQKLRDALSRAIQQEDYERAAALRDQLAKSGDATLDK